MNKYAEYKEAYKAMIKEAISASLIQRAALNSANSKGNGYAINKLYNMLNKSVDSSLGARQRFINAKADAGTLTVPKLKSYLASGGLPTPDDAIKSLANTSNINRWGGELGRLQNRASNTRDAYEGLLGKLMQGM